MVARRNNDQLISDNVNTNTLISNEKTKKTVCLRRAFSWSISTSQLAMVICCLMAQERELNICFDADVRE